MTHAPAPRETLTEQRWEVLGQLDDWLETPMVLLGLAWLALLVVELISGLSPFLEAVGTAIWIAFILDFLLRIFLAPRKLEYLRSNWLTAVALVLPAVRVLRAFRVVRALRAARGLRLVRIVTSLNRGMRALGRSMHRRGLGYVLALSTLVYLAGAAGILAFERASPESAVRSFADSLWWTAMLLTTIGSDYWPQSPEGRVLTLLLSIYALGVLGYVTAALASFFLGRDAESEEGEIAGEAALRGLRAEIRALRGEIRSLREGAPAGENPVEGGGGKID